MIFFLWIFGAFFVGFVFGTARTIGFWGSFLISLILSPLIGLAVTLFSETKTKAADRKRMLQLQQQQTNALQQFNKPTASITNDLERLNKMKANGMLSEEEYQQAKKKLLS